MNPWASKSKERCHHCICRSTASRSPVLTRGGICVLPTVTYLPYRVSRSTLTAVGRSRLLARWPGTHSRILSELQRAAQTVLDVYLKRTCSRVTSAFGALGVLNAYALYKSTHSLTHSRKLKQFEKIHIIIDMFLYTVTIAIYLLLKSITTPTSKNPR